MNTPAVTGINIEKTFSSEFNLFVSRFDASYGRVYGFYGPNGSGKTTFMKILGLIMAPDSGDVVINGCRASVNKLEIKRKMSFVFQEPKLLKRKVRDNLKFPLKLRNESVSAENIKNILKKLSLNPQIFLNKKPHELSGGEKKRISLAQKLIFEPDIILLDEPTANIDSKSLAVITSLLAELKEQNKCIIVSSHDYEWLSATADEIYYLSDGHFYTEMYENDLGRDFEYHYNGLFRKRFGAAEVIAASSSENAGECGYYINPNDIIISLEKLSNLSAQNIIQMKVKYIDVRDKNVKLELEKDKFKLTSYISKKALADLDIYKSKSVYAVFKASSVKSYK